MNWINTLKASFSLISNTLLLLIIVSLLSIIAENYYYSSAIPSYENSNSYRQKNYSHMQKADVDGLLKATWEPGYQYEEVLGFREKQRTTKFVNVNELGFRSFNSAKSFYSDLQGSVWFLGGSTTFGYGVADDETIPAYLEQLTMKKVVNLGRGYYYSEQENLLLLDLLKYGNRPKKVIFFDGLNERCDLIIYQKEMEMLFGDQQTQSFTSYLISLTKPSLRFMEKILSKIKGKPLTESQSQDSIQNLNRIICDGDRNVPIPLKSVLNSHLQNRKAICESYNLDCTTLVQPIAGIHGINKEAELNDGPANDVKRKFNHLKETFEKNEAVFVTASLNNFSKHAFIDYFHYSAEANLEIAKYVLEKLKLK